MAQARTATLDIAYADSGPRDGRPVVLLHGYPYDIRAFDAVGPILNAAGLRTITPYLRGYGETRLRSPDAPRAGQQAAIGQDLLDLLDALQIPRAVLAGFDWGARAACVVSAIWPERVHGLVSCGGYQIQDIARASAPADPDMERRLWYQYYFHTERGRNGLLQNRAAISRLLWQLWSPTSPFDEATFKRTAAAFDNPDFVDVVVHSYRHRTGHAPGYPAYAALEARLAMMPKISVPTIVVHGADDDVTPPMLSVAHHRYFSGAYERRLLEGVGHNPPHEAPAAFAAAVLDVCQRS
jgi:pimeloyl-ACP methyl ester carboxylesterase